jgi:hypothetical protein
MFLRTFPARLIAAAARSEEGASHLKRGLQRKAGRQKPTLFPQNTFAGAPK